MADQESGGAQQESAVRQGPAEEAPPVPPATAGVGGGAPGVASPPNPGGTPPGSVPGASLAGAGSASTGAPSTGAGEHDGR